MLNCGLENFCQSIRNLHWSFRNVNIAKSYDFIAVAAQQSVSLCVFYPVVDMFRSVKFNDNCFSSVSNKKIDSLVCRYAAGVCISIAY